MRKLFLLGMLSGFLFAEAPVYKIYQTGRPFIAKQNKMLKNAKERGINIEFVSLGCMATKHSDNNKNIKAKKYYDEKYEKDWLKNLYSK